MTQLTFCGAEGMNAKMEENLYATTSLSANMELFHQGKGKREGNRKGTLQSYFWEVFYLLGKGTGISTTLQISAFKNKGKKL